jgi:hypothetical protein
MGKRGELMRADVKTLPPQNVLLGLLSYDAETGQLRWRMKEPTSRANICFNNRCGGKLAGTVTQGRGDGDNKYLILKLSSDGPWQANSVWSVARYMAR